MLQHVPYILPHHSGLKQRQLIGGDVFVEGIDGFPHDNSADGQ